MGKKINNAKIIACEVCGKKKRSFSPSKTRRFCSNTCCGLARRKKIEYDIDPNGCHNCNSHHFDENGYPRVREGYKQTKLSRVIYKKYKGELEDYLIIRHTCDNPSCINPDHLIKGTHKDNMQDALKRGRLQIGEKHYASKITKELAKMIKKDNTSSINSLAKKYNISYSTVRGIRIGKNWKHIK